MVGMEFMFSLNRLATTLILYFALVQHNGINLKPIYRGSFEPSLNNQVKIGNQIGNQGTDTNIRDEKRTLQTNLIVQSSTEGDCYMDLKDINIADRSLIFPSENCSPTAENLGSSYTRLFPVLCSTMKYFRANYFPSYTMKTISKGNLFNLCFSRPHGFNMFVHRPKNLFKINI
ncbi:uncharacterized protein LOC122061892 [Macadamia integrifolia]|uniref:uncharacterized protein LOC122061892 n=1 Tax=Macadamia integrifolia TaxID=60698 RepID=UPI001C52E58A|nr:uncharacterized protein LOC122061892 [Macadamia integrifolia]